MWHGVATEPSISSLRSYFFLRRVEVGEEGIPELRLNVDSPGVSFSVLVPAPSRLISKEEAVIKVIPKLLLLQYNSQLYKVLGGYYDLQ
jgi:hypothetical protein